MCVGESFKRLRLMFHGGPLVLRDLTVFINLD